jgi:hypothetical protein
MLQPETPVFDVRPGSAWRLLDVRELWAYRELIYFLSWRDLIFSHFYHPLQKAFFENQDVFNTMLVRNAAFNVVVFRHDGTMETSGHRT